MTELQVLDLGLLLATAATAGLVGCFALMRRMTLAADALSHVALPGLGLAALLRIEPVLGAAVMLLLGAALIWGLERRVRMATETIVGVVFSAALAAGSLLTSGEPLVEALLGRMGSVTKLEMLLAIGVVAVLLGFLVRERHALVLALVSPDIARTSGVEVARLELGFLLVFALTIALGLRYLGVLLMGSLAIIPAATAKRLALDLRGMLTIAVASAIASTLAGTYLALRVHREPGPVVVLCAAGVFFASLGVRSRGGRREAVGPQRQ